MSDIFDTISYKEKPKDIFDDVSESWGVSDTARSVGAVLGGFAAVPVAGLTGIAKAIKTRDMGEIEKGMEKVSSLPQKLLTTDRQREAVENVSKIFAWPFQKAGAGYAGLTELASTGDLQKAVDVIRGDAGSNVFVPTARVLGEAAAMGALSGLGKGRGKGKGKAKVEELVKEEPKRVVAEDIFDTVAKEKPEIAKPAEVPVAKQPWENEMYHGGNLGGEYKRGISFTPEVDVALGYADRVADRSVTSANLNIKNPLIIESSEYLKKANELGAKSKSANDFFDIDTKMQKYAKDNGHDAIVQIDKKGELNEVVVFDKSQIVNPQIIEKGGATNTPLVKFVEQEIIKGATEQRAIDYHRRQIKQALSEGKPVPPEVLKDYPELAKQTVEGLEAQVKGGRVGDLPKYAEGSSINLERLNTTQDVKQLLNGLTQKNEAVIGKRKISWEETRQAAKDLGWDEKEFLKTAREKKGFSAAEIDAMRQIHGNAIEDLHRTLREMPADSAKRTDAMKMEVLSKINNYIQIMKETSTKSSEAGRALNIHKRLIEEDPAFINAKKVFDALDGKKITDGLINDLSTLDFKDTAKVKEVIKKHWSGKVHDMFFEAWLNAILSGPATHATNILSNTLVALTKIPETAISSTLAGRNPFREVRAETVGIWNGMKEGTRAALKAFKTGESSDLWGKLDVQHTPSIPGKVGEYGRTPTKSLTAEDEFFKSVVYRSELNRLAYVKSKGNATKMADLMTNPTEDMLIAAHKEALYRTFNKPLGKFGNHIMMIRNEIPGLKYAIPFIRTPANIAKYALERTPANFAKLAYDYKKGKITGEQFKTELAKPILGTAIQITIYELTKEGLVTGGGPKESTKRESLYLTGWQPYSIKIGDTYYPYNRLEPVGSLVGIAADLSEIVGSKEDRNTNKLVGQIATSFGKNITSKTFLSGIINLMDAISDPQRYGEKWINQLSGSVVPSVVGAVTRSQDPQMYTTETPLDVIKAKAGMTEGLYPKRDIWGEPIQRAGTPTQRLISPIVTSKARNDAINSELVRLDIHPSSVSKKISGIELTPEEHDRYARLSGEEARKTVSAYVSSNGYRMIKDEIKKIGIERLMEASRRKVAALILSGMERNRRMQPINKRYGLANESQGGQQ